MHPPAFAPESAGRALRLLLAASLLLACSPAAHAQDDDGGVPDYVAVKVSTDRESYRAGETARVTLEMKIDPRVHINAHVPTVDYQYPTDVAWGEASGLAVSADDIAWPKPLMKAFEFTEGAKIAVLEGTQKITIPVRVAPDATPGTLSLPGTFSAQGCTHSVCYAPQFDEFVVNLVIAAAGAAPSSVTAGEAAAAADAATDDASAIPPAAADPQPGPGDPLDDPDAPPEPAAPDLSTAPAIDGEGKPAFDCPVDADAAKGTKDRPLLWVFLASYMGGILLTFTPCVLPLVPITIGIFARQQNQGGRPVVPALMYVLGLALVYAALGTSAALTGNLFGAALQNKWVLIAIAALLFALALSMFGLWNLELPAGLRNRIGGFKAGPIGPMFMGGAMGIVAAPCVGPFVVSLLTYVANLGATMPGPKAAAIGGALFFVLAVGLGTPFFVVALGAASLRPGEWMDGVKRVFGFIILGVVLWFLRPVFGAHGTAVFQWGLVAVLASAAAYFFVTAKAPEHGPRLRGIHRIGAAAAAIATIALAIVVARGAGGPAAGADGFVAYSHEAVEQAKAEGQPIVIDFGATWCIVCKELEHKTFPTEQVRDAGKDFARLRADLTEEGSPAVKELRRRYAVRGLPTVIFLDSTGKEIEGLRLTGFEGPEGFSLRLKCASSFDLAARM